MNRSDFEAWTDKLGKAWSDRKPEAAASLFSKDCKYYESVFEKPCLNWEDILKLWSVVPENQKDIRFEFKIILHSEKECITNWKVTRTLLPSNEEQCIDGIFQISLNEEGLCNYFKQWRSVKKYK